MSKKKLSSGSALMLYFDAGDWCREKVMETAELYSGIGRRYI